MVVVCVPRDPDRTRVRQRWSRTPGRADVLGVRHRSGLQAETSGSGLGTARRGRSAPGATPGGHRALRVESRGARRHRHRHRVEGRGGRRRRRRPRCGAAMALRSHPRRASSPRAAVERSASPPRGSMACRLSNGGGGCPAGASPPSPPASPAVSRWLLLRIGASRTSVTRPGSTAACCQVAVGRPEQSRRWRSVPFRRFWWIGGGRWVRVREASG